MNTQRLFVLGLGLFTLLFVVVAAGFGYLYVEEQTEVEDLENEVLRLESELDEVDDTEVMVEREPVVTSACTDECLVTFRDDEVGLEAEFPSTWTPIVNNTIEEEIMYPDAGGFGPILSNYELRFEKGTAVLNIRKLLGPVDGFPSGLSNDEVEIVELEAEGILRYRLLDTTNWTYAREDDCSDISADLFPEVAAADRCVSQFFPGFGERFPTQVFVESGSDIELAQADGIVLSALE